MPKKDVKSLDAYKLPKNRERWLEVFIENASSRSLSAAPWDVNWNRKQIVPPHPVMF